MRYAIYFSPPAADLLVQAASRWLGRDAFTGEALPQESVDGLSAERLAELTADPRRYGFHATLKAPFELAGDRNENELLAAFAQFCETEQAFDIPEIAVGRIGAFFALVPTQASAPLQDFAARVVERFEPFRAPLSNADIARRKPELLSEAERRNLDRWGYPYVFDSFRFHMTLTGRVPQVETELVREVLEHRFSAFHGRPLPVSGLALVREDSRNAPFTVQTWSPLRAAR